MVARKKKHVSLPLTPRENEIRAIDSNPFPSFSLQRHLPILLLSQSVVSRHMISSKKHAEGEPKSKKVNKGDSRGVGPGQAADSDPKQAPKEEVLDVIRQVKRRY